MVIFGPILGPNLHVKMCILLPFHVCDRIQKKNASYLTNTKLQICYLIVKVECWLSQIWGHVCEL